ncbi:uncharacterized protein LOC131606329 isoform X2 [Vicia villosa]|uniref:uncharacterized protein LOC131606329 isoform X2 n=1 Tax=Vicia villosa TaxID=3911 RepID=UPI00273A9F54|nr:uncharacterized protein LOC131606329 isoform X2 [Vicia villosa]
MAATGTLNLPIIDLSSPHRLSTASSIRQACVEYGFFYLVNHGIDEDFLNQAFEESAKFFSLPIQHKINLHRKDYRGYTPLYAEKLDTTSLSQGDSKESYYIGPLTDATSVRLNPWPSQGELGSNEEICGASAHSDYGMITLLLTNGVPGLQICKDKLKQPQVWEDVPHVEGAMIVNIGDMMERWTNCLYQSALHRVMPTGKERYSVAFFMDPPSDCVVECFESCCSESSPPRFPPIRSEDYLNEKFKLTYDSERDLQCSI